MTKPNEISAMKARISLLEDSIKGLEELVIHVLERNEIQRKGNVVWTRKVPNLPQA